MPVTERRRLARSLPVEIQSRAEGQMPLITGYAAVFYDANDPGTEYRIYGDIVERIMPTAFDRAIKEDDVRGLFNHDDDAILGRVKSGTLRLSVDSKGLRYEIDPPDTQSARDLIQSIKRGDITGSSFSFIPDTSTWRETDGEYIVMRDAVTLFDVGPVTFPAYASTDAAVRAGGTDREAVRRELDKWASTREKPAPVADCRAALLARARAVETMLGAGFP